MIRMKQERHNLLTYLLFGLAIVLLIAGTISGEGNNERDNGKLLSGRQVTGQISGQAAEQMQIDALVEDETDIPQLLRFHVLANSDDKEDQQLKNEVKNVLVEYLKEKLGEVDSLKEAEEVIASEMSNIERIAREEITARGFSYQVTGEIGIVSFPTRMYGDAIYPAGDYKALRIIIGEGKGENWWCVLFPALCFVEGARVVAETSDDTNQKPGITTEEINPSAGESGLQKKQQASEVKFKFKIIEYVLALLK